jgi:uncharacterized SAM-binding protein YcdF (DUF218 family)
MDQVVFKFFGWLITIDRILMILLLLGFAALYTSWWKAGRRVIFTTVAITFVTIVVPTGFQLMSFLENRFPEITEIPSDAKGIILLGGSFDLRTSAALGRPSYNMAGGRIIDFMGLINKYPHLPILFTGAGAVANPKANESAIMKDVLVSFGVDLNRVTFEDRSKSTIENAKLSYDLIKPKAEDKWVLVTSAFHMPRSVALFRAAGWNVIPCPVDYHLQKDISWFSPNFDLSTGLLMWSHGIREIGGMSTNYLAGRTEVWIAQ